jgi:metal-responsive CopG/Arc/MetJ family transcriptional regulator
MTAKKTDAARQRTKVSITLDNDLLEWIDRAAALVYDGSRSRAIAAYLHPHFEFANPRRKP